MPFFDVQNGVTTGDQSLWNQFADALSGANDVGQIKAFAPISTPGAPTAAVNATAGNLTGAYQYAIAFITGYWQGPQGSGTLRTQGNTGGGTASATVSPNAQQVNLSNIPTGPTGTVARAIYRTKANGSSFFLVAQINDNTSTTYADNTADASLGAAMPTTNTTGTKFVGDGSQLTGVVTTSEVGAVNGVAPLDGTGKVPTANLPSSTLASVKNQSISSTSATQLFTFTPTTSGIYTVKAYLRVITAATNITLTTAYADSGGAQSYTPAALNNTSVAVGSHSVIDYTFEAVAGTSITLTITAGTASQVFATAALVGVA